MEQLEGLFRSLVLIGALLSSFGASGAAKKGEWNKAASYGFTMVGMFLFLIVVEIGDIEIKVNINEEATPSSLPGLPVYR